MNDKAARASRVIKKRLLIRYAPVIVIASLFAGYTVLLTNPACFSSDQVFQARARELDRVVFTTYFN
nr:hypothetical protein [Candidatus Sigynarchaeum springense]